MTAFVVTLTDQAAWLSADCLMAEPVHVDPELIKATEDAQAALASAYGGGGGPATVTEIGSCCKVWVAPHRGLIMSGAGSWLSLAQFAEVIGTRPEITSIESVPDAAERWLPQLVGDREMMTVVAGWSTEQNRIAAFAFTAASGNVDMVALKANTHSMQPVPDPDSDVYDAILQMQERARHGCEVIQFHRAVIRNCHASYLAGRLRAGVGVGREMVSAMLNADGISLQHLG